MKELRGQYFRYLTISYQFHNFNIVSNFSHHFLVYASKQLLHHERAPFEQATKIVILLFVSNLTLGSSRATRIVTAFLCGKVRLNLSINQN